MRKIIFLDIDGVLNSAAYDRTRKPTDGNIDESRLPLLKDLVSKTDAEIVLSSTWKEHWDKDDSKLDSVGKELNNLFAKYGLSIADKTPLLQKNDRAEEIKEWLQAHKKEIDTFVILDDTFGGWAELEPHLVKTNYRIGRALEENHIQKAISILINK